MQKRTLQVLSCVLILSLIGLAQTSSEGGSASTSSASSSKMKTASKKSMSGAPDKAYMQQIWDGWSTLDPSHVAQFYATGPHTFFDIAPLKYNSWDEYQAGVKQVLADYQSATCTVNDDAQVHHEGNLAWGSATIKYEMDRKSGKKELGNFRWTVIWEKQGGKWLIVHEHVSEPIS